MKLSNVLLGLTATCVLGFASCKPKDSTIQTVVDEKLKSIPELSGVHAEVKDGVITLSGDAKDNTATNIIIDALKKVKGVQSVTNNITLSTPEVAKEVMVSADETLTKTVTDAIKDFNGVKASVKDGIVTLTGDIAKTSLPKLMMALNALHPKKIENKLTIK